MAEKKSISVWDMYNDMYNRGMSKGKNKFVNWMDNPLKPNKTRFSLGHLWHGKGGIRSVGDKNMNLPFKELFQVGKSIGGMKLAEEIISKGTILHDYTKYNKTNPKDQGSDSASNLMGILEHKGSKYAKFVNKLDSSKIDLYELKGADIEWGDAMNKLNKQKETGMNLNEAFASVKKQLLDKKPFRLGVKKDALEILSDKSARKAFNVKLTAEGERELIGKVQSQEKKRKGVKAGVAIAKDFADTLRASWERSYRG